MKNKITSCKNKIDMDIRRFLELERGWIKSVSHEVVTTAGGISHYDRENLRQYLFDYLKSKIKEEKA